jgi:hypothetical protein
MRPFLSKKKNWFVFLLCRLCDMFSSYKMRGIILFRKVGVIVLLNELYIKVLCAMKHTSLIMLVGSQPKRHMQHSKSSIDHWLESHHTINGLAVCNKDKKWMIIIPRLSIRYFLTTHKRIHIP